MKITQNCYIPENEMFWMDNYLIVSSKTYNDIREHFYKEFEKERKVKWYKKAINAIRNLKARWK